MQSLQQNKKKEESKLEPMKKAVRQMESKLGSYNKDMIACRTGNVLKAVRTKFEEECDKIEVRCNEIHAGRDAIIKQEKDRQKHVEAAVQKLNALSAELNKFDAQGDDSDCKILEYFL
jgi:hypothetical protein